MMNRQIKKNTVLMATDPLAEPILNYLNRNFNLKLVVTAPPKKTGRGQINKTDNRIASLAKKLSIPLLRPNKLDDQACGKINQAKPDFIIVFAYGKIIPLDKIKTDEILNIHPSLLPKLRGPAPIRYAILEGLEKTGISLMKIDQEIDHGPVIDQIEINMDNDENYYSLREKVSKKALELVKKNLKPYLEAKIKAKPQDHSQATFSKWIKKEDGLIDWDRSPEEIERKIRAFNPWPGSYTKLKDGKILKIYSAEIKNNKLKLGEVQLEGRNKISFKDFKRGYRQKLDFLGKLR